jgi:predicted PurR-regulated permease PerM
MVKKYPFYIKSTVILAGLTLFVYVIANLQDILIPLAFALILSILLNPLVNLFIKWKIPKLLSILIAIIIGFLVFGGLTYFLSSQIMSFTHELPQLKQKFAELSNHIQHWLHVSLGISLDQQQKFLNESVGKLKPIVERAIGSLFGTVLVAFLVPIYIILILFYKTLILNFIFEVFASKNSTEVEKILAGSKIAVQSYMVGLLIEGAIVATLNSLALMLLGVKYAILLGVLGAIINVLPFIGGVLSTLLPLFIATMTKTGFGTQIGIIIAYIIIQFADNHFLIPLVVSARVKLNALISLIVVSLGGAVWGLAGMFLSIPIIGVLKIIMDRIPELKPWGKLLGNEIPRSVRANRLFRRNDKLRLSPHPKTVADAKNI